MSEEPVKKSLVEANEPSAASSSSSTSTSSSSSSSSSIKRVSENQKITKLLEYAIRNEAGLPVKYIDTNGCDHDFVWNPTETTRFLWSRGNHYPSELSNALLEEHAPGQQKDPSRATASKGATSASLSVHERVETPSVEDIFDYAETIYGKCATAQSMSQRQVHRTEMKGKLVAVVLVHVSKSLCGVFFKPSTGSSPSPCAYKGGASMTTLTIKTLATTGTIKFAGFGHVYPEDLVQLIGALYAKENNHITLQTKKIMKRDHNGDPAPRKRGRPPIQTSPPVTSICSTRALYLALCHTVPGAKDLIREWIESRPVSREPFIERLSALLKGKHVVFDARKICSSMGPPSWGTRLTFESPSYAKAEKVTKPASSSSSTFARTSKPRPKSSASSIACKTSAPNRKRPRSYKSRTRDQDPQDPQTVDQRTPKHAREDVLKAIDSLRQAVDNVESAHAIMSDRLSDLESMQKEVSILDLLKYGCDDSISNQYRLGMPSTDKALERLKEINEMLSSPSVALSSTSPPPPSPVTAGMTIPAKKRSQKSATTKKYTPNSRKRTRFPLSDPSKITRELDNPLPMEDIDFDHLNPDDYVFVGDVEDSSTSRISLIMDALCADDDPAST